MNIDTEDQNFIGHVHRICEACSCKKMIRSFSSAVCQRASHTTLYTGNGALGAEVTSVTGFPRPRYPLPRGLTSVWPVATSPWRDWVICAPAAFLSRGFHPLGVPPVATLGRTVQPPSRGPLGTLNNSAHRAPHRWPPTQADKTGFDPRHRVSSVILESVYPPLLRTHTLVSVRDASSCRLAARSHQHFPPSVELVLELATCLLS